MKKVLVAGATGMVGKRLVELLLEQGLEVNVLSTRKNATVDGAAVFQWNPNLFKLDDAALDGVDAIINLAGASINKRWTTSYKQEIYDSRTRPAETLLKALSKKNHSIKSYLSAAAVGIYPSSFDKTFVEDDEPGKDFLAQVCQAWETSADKIAAQNIRVVKLRIGIVLSREGGELKEFESLANKGLAAPLATGKHWRSWIHLDDLCRMFIHVLLQTEMEGSVNAAAPNPVTNRDFIKKLAAALHKPAIFPAVPEFVLKLILGEMATIATSSQKVSVQKMQDSGFQFRFNTLDEALTDLYKKNL